MRLDRRFVRLLVVIALLALPQPATAAQPLIVGDGTPASCTEAALQQAVAVAAVSGGGTIRFKCGTDPVIITLTATLTPPNNTTIDGGGVITLETSVTPLSVFVAPDTTVVLKNLGHGHSRVTNQGTLIVKNNRLSAIIDSSGTLEVHESIFSKVNFQGAAGAIINSGTLTVRNSMFLSNSINMRGILNRGDATVHNSTFFDNHSDGGDAIWNEGTLTVDNSMFVHNGGQCGGAILNLGTVTVKNSIFSDNGAGGVSCDHGGGGIANYGTATIYNSALFGNTARDGGGIANLGTLTIYNSELFGNTAGQGGGVYNEGALTVTRSVITGNTAGDGGGIYSCCGGTLTLEDSSVEGNTPNDIVP